MKALLLAGGFGTRLEKGYNEYAGPLKEQLKNWVKGKPKGLVHIKGQPIASHVVCQLLDANISKADIYVQTNDIYFTQYQLWAEKHNIPTKNILTNGITKYEDRLESLGDLKHALDHCIGYSDSILVIASDTLLYNHDGSLYSFKNLVEGLNTKGGIHLTGYIAPKERLTKHGILQLDQHNKVINFEEKPIHPKSNIAHAFVNLYGIPALQYLKEHYNKLKSYPHPIVHMHQFFPTYAHIVPKRVDIGTIEDVISENVHSVSSQQK